MSSNRLDSIQVLRAIAAIAVVFFHTKTINLAPTYDFGNAWLNRVDPFNTGQCGVDIFFVISGFIMAMVTNGRHKRKGAFWDFLQKRFIRIIPPYWLWTLFLLFLFMLFPHLSKRTFECREAILSLLLVPYTPSMAEFSPILSVGWTLQYEIYFYALVGFGLFFPRKNFIVGMGIFFLMTTAFLPQRYGPLSRLMADTILWEFFAGVLLFELFKTGKSLPIKLSIVFSILAITAFYYFAEKAITSSRFIYWGIPALSLVASFISLEKKISLRIPNILVFLGDSSYTLYLCHIIILSAITRFFVLVGLNKTLPPDVIIILFTTISIICGCILYVISEKPILDYLMNKRIKYFAEYGR